MAILTPTLSVERVTDISPEMLRDLGVQTVLLDVDNTLARHGSQEPFEGSIAWTHRLRQAGFKLIIVSNNSRRRVAPFAAQYDLPFLYRAYKPLPSGYRRAAALLQGQAASSVVIGDQIFTDIAGANFSGMKSILLVPAQEEHALSFRVRRCLERPLRKRFAKKGIHQSKQIHERSGKDGNHF